MDPHNIQRRRALENKLEEARAVVQQRDDAAQLAFFEKRTDSRIERRMAREELQKAKELMHQDLQRRRAKCVRFLF